MFEYFPDNYNWSLAVSLALGMGGELSEIDDACRGLRPLAAKEDDTTLQAWFEAWTAIAARATALADADAAAANRLTAARKYRRAANYHLMAERMMTHRSPKKRESYDEARRLFRLALDLSRTGVELVEVPFEGVSLPALFVPAKDVHGSAPCLIMFNGFDVTKEYQFLMGVDAIADRGISLLITDQPGSGGALRIHGLPTRIDMEVPAGACVDYLETRTDVDADRIGISGISMGGYFAPRAAAMEPRLQACVAWGACHDVPHAVDLIVRQRSWSAPRFQTPWVFGTEDPTEQNALVQQFRLHDVIGKLTCPLLVMHGEDDRQIPVEQAHWTVEQASGSVSAKLKLFGPWGNQHCQADNQSLAVDYMADWLVSVL